MSSEPVLRPARRVDIPGIEKLLTSSDLPIVGVRDAIDGFLVAEDGAELVGAVGIERCGSLLGLLRSAVVAPARRGQGVGRRLVERAIADSRSRGMEALYLLTTTAEDYFPSFGFTVTTRDRVPEVVRATAEFTKACPDTATVMTLELNGESGVDYRAGA